MSAHGVLQLIEQSASMPWLDDAACADMAIDELERFFVEAGRSISAQTVAMCTACPVRRECLEHAYRLDIAGGYFGGMSPGRRRALPLTEALRVIGAPAPAAGGAATV
jgi:WhiB family transcriptional regulator, redox-sensing transcriptional regulator